MKDQAAPSRRSLGCSALSSNENDESPAFRTRSKKSKVSDHVGESPALRREVLEPLSRNQDSTDLSLRGQPLREFLVTRQSKVSIRRKRNLLEARDFYATSEESRLGRERRKATNGLAGRIRDTSSLVVSESEIQDERQSCHVSIRPDEGVDLDLSGPGKRLQFSRETDDVTTLQSVSDISASDARNEPLDNSQGPACTEAHTSSQHNCIPVTPARQPPSAPVSEELQTPEHLVPALGEGQMSRRGECATDGNILVFQRRNHHLRKDFRQPATCPRQNDTRLRLLHSARPRASTSKRNNVLLPESYRREICAYFAEVDAFELDVEFEGEDDD